MFSRRTGWDLTPNPLSAREESLRRAGAELIDLTESNPTRCGLGPGEETLRRLLAPPGLATYSPDPRGLRIAREAIGARWGANAEDLLLTAGTSEAYGQLFKLLCDPGDAVIVFTPGYPLLEHLAALESVTLLHLPLLGANDWAIPIDEVERVLANARARAVVVVSPANPTGQVLSEAERRALDRLCAAHDAALIVDEVFADYGPGPSAMGVPSDALTFVLSGLSKTAALPQLKLGWIAVQGPEALRQQAVARLEVIADAYLSVATPVQLAVPELLRTVDATQARIHDRLGRNRAALERVRPPEAPWSILPIHAGWSAVLRIPRHPGDEATASAALEAGVLVHPGHLYDLPPAHLVLSLLPEPGQFDEGLRRLLATADRPPSGAP